MPDPLLSITGDAMSVSAFGVEHNTSISKFSIPGAAKIPKQIKTAFTDFKSGFKTGSTLKANDKSNKALNLPRANKSFNSFTGSNAQKIGAHIGANPGKYYAGALGASSAFGAGRHYQKGKQNRGYYA